jgi:Putative GTPases (G3E family)
MNNPKLILFTGFLGSGKTSLLLKIAKELSQQQKRCAIIVNEVGEIGIDNLQMKKMGYDVWEIFGGCICCTLAISLDETMHQLLEQYETEYILMEPSGAADPSALYPTLAHCGFTPDRIKNVMIMDPTRVEMLVEVLEPYLEAAIPLADLAVINKIDVAIAAEIEQSERVIRQYNPGVLIAQINVNELNVHQIKDMLK